MNAAILIAAKQHAAPVSGGSKAGAILIGLAFLVVVYVAVALITGHWSFKELFTGFDGFGSTSKLQWLLWLIVILYGYAALWVLRALNHDFTALSDIPVNVLTVLGFSTGTAAAAKGITAGFVQTGKVPKAGAPATSAAGKPSAATTGGIFQDDSGGPELAKIQLMAFTLLGIGVFLTAVFHQIAVGDLKDGLPNIDSSLLVLMGISQGGYLGKKLVTFGTPTLLAPSPLTGPPGTPVTVSGSGLGASKGTTQLLFNGSPVETTNWSDTAIEFTVPDADPKTGAPWPDKPEVVDLVVSMMGQPGNSATFTVTPETPPETPSETS
jgi:IPT/TIG domain